MSAFATNANNNSLPSIKKIIRQRKILVWICGFFAITMFLGAAGFFTAVYFFKKMIDGLDILKINSISDIKSFSLKAVASFVDWRKTIIICIALVASLLDIVVSVYFVRNYRKKRIANTKKQVVECGSLLVGEIICMEVFNKSFYEIEYKAFFKCTDNNKYFAFYSVLKSQPLPIGEVWQIYCSDNGFAVLDKRLKTPISLALSA